MHKQFHGVYAPYIEQHIAFKRALGFKYNREETTYSYFDKFTITRGEKVIGITRDMANEWRDLNPNESDSSKFHRCICLSQLASFLCKIGIRSYIPQLPQFKRTFIPHIYSKNEIAAIFKACDELRSKKKRMDSLIIILPALFRMLYSTGLRISEALSLLDRDVNLTDNYLKVRDSKNGKDRIIPISESLSLVCKEYANYRDLYPLCKNRCTLFFKTLSGNPCKTDSLYKRFSEILQKANISKNNKGPRLHDFRHTFSVHSLAIMAEAGIDLYCALPTLSTYLGHQSLEATNGYVRLTSEMYPGLLKDVDLICLNVFPSL